MTIGFDDPTPCPRPRGSGARRPSILLQDQTEDFTRSFRNTKPRRRASSRPSLGWDPTIDIYDDTFDFSKCHPQRQPPGAQQSLAQAQPRRTTLFSQPAQRPKPVARNVEHRKGEEEAKRRRVSVAYQHRTGLEPIQDEHTTVDLTMAASDIKKDPRRRTIYIPSDDTTIMTIHPGAALHSRRHPTCKPARCDNVADLAAIGEEDGEVVQHQRTAKKSSRPSLAAAPRRNPLQQTSCSFMNQTVMSDNTTSGAGKENVPPGGLLGGLKTSRGPRALFTEDKTQPTANDHCNNLVHHRTKALLCKSSVLPEVNSPVKEPTSNDLQRESLRQKSADDMKGSNKPSGSGIAFRSPFLIERHRLSARRSSCLKFASEAYDKPSIQSVPTRLNIPSLAHRKSIAVLSKYPVLTEEIHVPEMYEDNWLSHQELAVAQLINSLFGSDGNRTSQTHSISRKTLLSMYQEPTMPLLYRRLQASLRFGALNIPNESLTQVSRLKDDIGQRQRFMNLWLKTYNLSSLQAAAEIVVGRHVPLYNQDSISPSPPTPQADDRRRRKALEAFFRTFLINNEDKIERRTTTANLSANSLLSQESSDRASNAMASMWRRTVLRSLMIILLLDKAQQAGVFRGCLFQNSSPFKASSAVLQSLSMLLLPSIGNVPRVLGHLNYNVRHVQYPLQEYDYHISNLATDLRDGVLLARLVETLLYSPSANPLPHDDVTLTLPSGAILTSNLDSDQGQSRVLSQHLKYPCTSRVQKLYNVQISLSALSELNDVGHLVQNTKAEDVVDGHREKTVSLLWSLVGRWGMELLLDFDLVGRETTRLSKELSHRRLPTDGDVQFLSELEKHHSPAGLDRCTNLLKVWANYIARLHGLTVANLSTSFASGEVYNAIANEYTAALRSCNVLAPSTAKTEQVDSRVSTSKMLMALGCSHAFSDMFRSDFGMASEQTTVPLLAFLASRLIPLSQPYFAARMIQRAWRRKQSWQTFRRRLVLAYLANDCAAVVRTRERLVWAVLVLQRRWRDILRKGSYSHSHFWRARLLGDS